ncbi:MAG: acylphosphatase [Treponema sp.]|jgi:acylphosphatase|nr:acylphosphatase [Treponema sp.]
MGIRSCAAIKDGSAFFASISGRVQGVGFRYFCLREAQRCGVSGWVRNTEDGKVEVLAEGPSSRLNPFLRYLHEGPPHARVDAVEYEIRNVEGRYKSFFIMD